MFLNNLRNASRISCKIVTMSLMNSLIILTALLLAVVSGVFK